MSKFYDTGFATLYGVFQRNNVTLLQTYEQQQKEHRRKYYIPNRVDEKQMCSNPEYIVFEDQGFTVSLNPSPDGSFLFAAVADQLQNIGVCRLP